MSNRSSQAKMRCRAASVLIVILAVSCLLVHRSAAAQDRTPGELNPVHRVRHPAFRAAKEEVVVRAHQAVGMDLDFTPTDGACQIRQEESVVLMSLEERPTRDRAVEDVVPTAGFVLTGDARHSPRDTPRRMD